MSAHASTDARPVLALFDFDGTLTTRETLPDFLRFATPPRRLHLGTLLFVLPVLAYRLKLLPVSVLRALLVRYAFGGLPRTAVEEAGRRFAATVLPSLVRPEMQARLDAHRARGDTVVVVSGGFDVYLAPWCASQGVELLCSSLEHAGDRMTGRYAGPQCVAAEKVRRVRQRYDVARYREIHAHGDTHEDLALLALADQAIYRGAPWPAGADRRSQ
ncbi:HAD-IB family hydrolase [Luteimonas sp. 9C]|uniref:HAD-IB family hydrolase n=1 Tax=Luteimonas sp. 9C TaxID=2653148 RepID=UPI0012EF812A|nr:HAD-IB family hydrolase [Luteimonas sp. 9C]VXB13699.1 HAD-IB family hydrolase [Luteimonas sp. 9C]